MYKVVRSHVEAMDLLTVVTVLCNVYARYSSVWWVTGCYVITIFKSGPPLNHQWNGLLFCTASLFVLRITNVLSNVFVLYVTRTILKCILLIQLHCYHGN